MTTPREPLRSPSSGSSAPRQASARQGKAAKPKRSFLQILGEQLAEWRTRPLTDYYLILTIVGALTVVGVIMVLSSSMTWSVIDNQNVFSTALKQSFMVVLGLVVMWLALRTRPGTLRKFATAALIVSILLLVAVLIPGVGTGRLEWGSQSWIVIGPLRLQPSELARVVIALWGAHYLADSDPHAPWRENKLVHFGLVSMLITALIFAEGDTGMSMSFLLVVAVLLVFAGLELRFLAIIAVMGLLAVLYLLFSGGYRSDRFTVFFDALIGHFEDTKGIAFQSYQGFLSLADGSLLGVGLGQSRAKWFYLPEAKNDFIFAIVGEELGLLGAGIIIFLFGLLGVIGLRTARRSNNQFLSLLSATLTLGVVIQAFINIGYVIGVLPVTGIQLPLISAGGTSAVITLGAMGILANCARHEPEAISAMASYGRPAIDQILLLREPDNRDLDRDVPAWRLAAPDRSPRPAPRPNAGASRPALRDERAVDQRHRAADPRGRNQRGGQGTAQGSQRGQRAENQRAGNPRGAYPRGGDSRGTTPQRGPQGGRRGVADDRYSRDRNHPDDFGRGRYEGRR